MNGNLNYALGSLAVVTLFGIGYCSDWVVKKYQNLRLLYSLVNNIKSQEKLENKPKVEPFQINDYDRSANITYTRMNESHTVHVPYSRKHIAAMSQFKAELLKKDFDPIDITQQPGIPYLINAYDLGGYAIRITDQETNKSHIYEEKVCPVYAEEVMDTE